MHCPSIIMIAMLECRPGRFIRKRSFFPDPVAWWAATDWDSGAEQVHPDLLRPTKYWHLAIVAAGWWNSVWLALSLSHSSHITILIHPLSLHAPELQQATESCSHSNMQAWRCPWGSFLDRIPRCPLPTKGLPLCGMAVYLCRHENPTSTPRLSSFISRVHFLLISYSERQNSSVN